MEGNGIRQRKEDQEKVREIETRKEAEHTPSRARTLKVEGMRARSMNTGMVKSNQETTGGTEAKEKTEKRKKESPVDGEGGRLKRIISSEGIVTDDEEEDKTQEELEWEEESECADDTIIEVEDDKEKEEDEKEWNRTMEETVEKCNMSEVKKLLKMVMADYRNKTKELEREKTKQEVQDQSELIKGFENMKKHVDESNEKWRRGVNEELGNLKAEIQQIKSEMEEWKGRGEGQDHADEGRR